MRAKLATALAAAAAIAGGVALVPTQASAWCHCGAYYGYGWYPAYQPVTTTYAQPVLVKKPVTTYVYEWSTRPVEYTYYAPTYRPVVYGWGWGAPPVVAFGR